MKIKDTILRSQIRRILSEEDSEKTSSFDLGLGASEIISIPKLTPGDNGTFINLSDSTDYKIQNLSIIVDAITTHKDGSNKVGWNIVSEQMLHHFGFSRPFGGKSTFFDVTKADVAYSVKSSFSKKSLQGSSILSNAYLNLSTLFKKRKGRIVVKLPSAVEQAGSRKAGVILCYRNTDAAAGTFDIIWKVSDAITFEELREKASSLFPADLPAPIPTAKGSSDNSDDSQTAEILFPEAGQMLNNAVNEKFSRVSSLEYKEIFGEATETLKIRFRDYSDNVTDLYNLKTKLINIIKKVDEEQSKEIETLLRPYLEEPLVS